MSLRKLVTLALIKASCQESAPFYTIGNVNILKVALLDEATAVQQYATARHHRKTFTRTLRREESTGSSRVKKGLRGW